MSVRFVIGRAGSGKTWRCFSSIVDALQREPMGRPIYWILPRQATFMAERMLACASGLGGFTRVRVVSFSQLGDDVLAECGGAAMPAVTQLGRQMILGHLLKRHEAELRFFNKVARHPGLAARLEGTLAEFERCGKDPEQLGKLAAELEGEGTLWAAADSDPLAAKIHDLHLIYRSYCQFLGQERVDPRRRMEHVVAAIGRSTRFHGAQAYVDGFAEFDEFERRVLGELGKLCPVEIMLLMDPKSGVLGGGMPDALSLFHRSEVTYWKLRKSLRDVGVKVERAVLLETIHRFTEAEALGMVERLGDSPLPIAHCRLELPMGSGQSSIGNRQSAIGNLFLVEAPDRRGEVEHAARWIGQRLREGMRLREIAVLVRDLGQYGDLINAVFAEHGIRYFVDRRRSMGHHPLLQLVRAVLGIAQHAWGHDAVMMLIKSGLAGLQAAEADRLENYVLEHRLRGSVWGREEPWSWRRQMTRQGEEPAGADESALADGLRRRVAGPLGSFVARFAKEGATAPLRNVVGELFKVMEGFAVRAQLAEWIDAARESQRHEQAGEHEQVWVELVGLFDQMVDLLGDVEVTLGDFTEILEAGLETFDLALAPPTVDEVLVGQVDRTRTLEVKACLVLGLNDGIFPRAGREASILSDPERIELQRRQFEVDWGTEQRLLDEKLLGYIALTRASQVIYASRALADDAGRALGPSVFWRRLREMFPEAEVTALPRDPRTEAELIGTPRELLTALMRWARSNADGQLPIADCKLEMQGNGGLLSNSPQSAIGNRQSAIKPKDPWPALYHWLAQYPPKNDLIDQLRFRTWKALGYQNEPALSPEMAEALFPSPLGAGVSQVEVFASCPFKHFLRYGLRLEKREEEETIGLDLEGCFHQALENLVRQMLGRRADWAALPPEQSGRLVEDLARQAAETLRGEMMLSNPRNRYLLTHIEKTLDQLIEQQKAVAGRSAFQTTFAKVDFGENGKLPPLVIETPRGRSLALRGRIDRVDVQRDEGAFAVLDYRLFGGELSLAHVEHGLSLQLLTYLLVLEAHGEKLAGRKLTPAAAFYVRLLRQLEEVKHPSEGSEPGDEKFALRGKKRGIFDGRFFADFDAQCDKGYSDVVAAYVKIDGSFGQKGRTDVAEGAELGALLEQVKKTVAQLGDQMMDGRIAIEPYRMGRQSPCSSCQYRSVCRFDPSINRYHQIPQRGREEVLRMAVEAMKGGKAR